MDHNGTSMRRGEAIQKLTDLMPELRELGVRSLSLFGSVARDESTSTSDLDVLIEFEGERTSQKFFGTLFMLEDRLGVKVDIAQPDTLHHVIKEKVLAEALKVA
jgi:uncharacterized protein